MAQVTIYLPDDVAEKVREEAQRARKSLSAYMAQLAGGVRKSRQWPDGFAELFGSWEEDGPPLAEPRPDEGAAS